MVQMLINIIFLGLILVPIFILFAALYQDLIETLRLKQKTRQKEAKAQAYHVESGKTLSSKLKIVK